MPTGILSVIRRMHMIVCMRVGMRIPKRVVPQKNDNSFCPCSNTEIRAFFLLYRQCYDIDRKVR